MESLFGVLKELVNNLATSNDGNTDDDGSGSDNDESNSDSSSSTNSVESKHPTARHHYHSKSRLPKLIKSVDGTKSGEVGVIVLFRPLLAGAGIELGKLGDPHGTLSALSAFHKEAAIHPRHVYHSALRGFSATLSESKLRYLSTHPHVLRVEPDHLVQMFPGRRNNNSRNDRVHTGAGGNLFDLGTLPRTKDKTDDETDNRDRRNKREKRNKRSHDKDETTEKVDRVKVKADKHWNIDICHRPWKDGGRSIIRALSTSVNSTNFTVPNNGNIEYVGQSSSSSSSSGGSGLAMQSVTGLGAVQSTQPQVVPRLYVLDTGIATDHPDLPVHFANRKNFVDGEPDEDLQGHGTHIAGIAAATPPSLTQVQVHSRAHPEQSPHFTYPEQSLNSDVYSAYPTPQFGVDDEQMRWFRQLQQLQNGIMPTLPPAATTTPAVVPASNFLPGPSVADLDSRPPLGWVPVSTPSSSTMVPQSLFPNVEQLAQSYSNRHNREPGNSTDNKIKCIGLAPGTQLYSVKVLDRDGDGKLSTILAAVEWLTTEKMQHPEIPMVANLSLGFDCGKTEYNALDEAIDRAIQVGITFVVAAGNDGLDARNYSPAHVERAITVGAYQTHPEKLADVNAFGKGKRLVKASIPDFSNWGEGIDLLAPGVDILSTWNGGRFDHSPAYDNYDYKQNNTRDSGEMRKTNTTSDTSAAPTSASASGKKKVKRYYRDSGTSMAAPHVAAAACLYLWRHPTATPAEVKYFLLRSAKQQQLHLSSKQTSTPNLILHLDETFIDECETAAASVTATSAASGNL